MVVMKKIMHRAIVVVCGGGICNLDDGAIPAVITPCCILPCSKTYPATIRSIGIHGLACKLVLHKGAQMEAQADTYIILIEYQSISTPKRMVGTMVPIAVRQKTYQNNPFHDKLEPSLCMLWGDVPCCDMSFMDFCHNSATLRSFGVIYILSCCQWKGETVRESIISNLRV